MLATASDIAAVGLLAPARCKRRESGDRGNVILALDIVRGPVEARHVVPSDGGKLVVPLQADAWGAYTQATYRTERERES